MRNSLVLDDVFGSDHVSHRVLDQMQRRVLWIASTMIYHANKGGRKSLEIKVGGHQASSASMVTIMTALYFEHLRAHDRVSVKPHAAPVLHAINYLLGGLDREYLTKLREYKGLQSYPSRTKDPDRVDFSTGSVGIGATATIWSALAQRFASDHSDVSSSGHHIALLGDAELDEGAVWEALVDPMVSKLSEVLWVVDVNRQSLDRIMPDLTKKRVAMFEAVGWNTITLKYGHRLRELFAMPGGERLQLRLDTMSNEEYQYLLRSPISAVRDRLISADPVWGDLRQFLGEVSDEDITVAIRDLGGHDLSDLTQAYRDSEKVKDRPTVIFAYTIKGWQLPIEGHPGNHSAILTQGQWEALGEKLGGNTKDPWSTFEKDSPEDQLCRKRSQQLEQLPKIPERPLAIPSDLGSVHAGKTSTQQTFGRFFIELARSSPEVASRVVSVSPDVASSTNLGGWINRVGIWSTEQQPDWFSDDAGTMMKWHQSKEGQHIELGIAEGNLVGLLSELGAIWSREGKTFFPIGTIYDPFVNRALEPWSFGMYSGGQSILVGTPSGVTLAPEGGAHQSIITPSVGLEQPGCIAWEPAFGQDLEWTLLYSLSQLGRPGGSSAYFRLTTRPLDQTLSSLPSDPAEREARRKEVLAGGYFLRKADNPPQVTLVGVGAIVPEVCAAAIKLCEVGIEVDVVCLTSPDLLFRAIQARTGLGSGESDVLEHLFPARRKAPILTVLDGHPHTLSFLSNIHGSPIACLGVSSFGEVGDISDLYKHFGIDSGTIIGAAFDLMELPN